MTAASTMQAKPAPVGEQLPDGLDLEQHRIICLHWFGLDPDVIASIKAIATDTEPELGEAA
ncbi:MAG: hypothetical protein MI920_17295 [Kiloniellales bacterium]|nr:hypothetical protein [Kiloniellales bacterium]